MKWSNLKKNIEEELHNNILNYWMENLSDGEGGLFGQIHNHNNVDTDSPIGLVMVSRFLWTYSEAFRTTGRAEYLNFARDMKDFFVSLLYDEKNRGFYWLSDHTGKALDKKKVLYGQAFALYGLSTLQMVDPSNQNNQLCDEIFNLLEKHGRDKEFGGYLEACSENWTYEGANNLGAYDLACDKSMNTNLHILEAYTRYYLQSQREDVKEALISLIKVITEKIYDRETGHQKLYFDKEWNSSGDVESYGHDVETSWLIWEALEILGDEKLKSELRETVLRLLDVSSGKATAQDGSLYNEKHDGHLDTIRIWWVQAEYAVSLMNAYEMTGEEKYKEKLLRVWDFIGNRQVDKQHGEWFWGIDDSGKPIEREKGGMWKTPYHNGRACMELLHRIEKIMKLGDSYVSEKT